MKHINKSFKILYFFLLYLEKYRKGLFNGFISSVLPPCARIQINQSIVGGIS